MRIDTNGQQSDARCFFDFPPGQQILAGGASDSAKKFPHQKHSQAFSPFFRLNGRLNHCISRNPTQLELL